MEEQEQHSGKPDDEEEEGKKPEQEPGRVLRERRHKVSMPAWLQHPATAVSWHQP